MQTVARRTRYSSYTHRTLDPLCLRLIHLCAVVPFVFPCDVQGWQLQSGAPTVQQRVEHALSEVLREPRTKLSVRAAGRTDAGVHASGQCVQFWT